jgi:hypothetical protein
MVVVAPVELVTRISWGLTILRDQPVTPSSPPVEVRVVVEKLEPVGTTQAVLDKPLSHTRIRTALMMLALEEFQE